ncbi:MAG: PEP-CTERM sorting domain-containing protein [Rhizobacter sp.]|nr:PEP-CTERM sorting domain-containing protein [Rhizobacter sp.]
MSMIRSSSHQAIDKGSMSENHAAQSRLRRMAGRLCLALSILGSASGNVHANAIIVGHDINTLGSFVAGSQESAFAVNVANYLTSGSATRSLLLFESNPGDGTRDFAPGVLAALTNAGFDVTVTSSYETPFSTFDALFVAQDYPTVGFLDNAALANYVSSGGSVYIAGGVGPSAATEAQGWNMFLNQYGLAFSSAGYNGIDSVTINSSHPIFSGIASLGSGNGQSILDLGTNSNAQIVQFSGTEGVYAVVSIPEPATVVLFGVGLFALIGMTRRAIAAGGIAISTPQKHTLHLSATREGR